MSDQESSSSSDCSSTVCSSSSSQIRRKSLFLETLTFELTEGYTIYELIRRRFTSCLGPIREKITVVAMSLGAVATYIRFFPYIMKNHNYTVVVFLLTFNLITVSSYHITSVLKIAQARFFTIVIGCGIFLLMSLLVLPIWSGKERHHRTISKLKGLATSIECPDTVIQSTPHFEKYFSDSNLENSEDSSSSDDVIYAAVLELKFVDDTLTSYARWEPIYSKYRIRFPWRQYVKVGATLRHFSYTVVALHGSLQNKKGW